MWDALDAGGNPGEVFTHFLRQVPDNSQEAWLPVLGSHGHGWLLDALVGSVAE
ncbi:MAG TPA: hypothetical protein VEO01_29150 [Pseudonocardiaceae bacterium]|nr:hypothetical protein [Pseudonocardiaceae bacterium]